MFKEWLITFKIGNNTFTTRVKSNNEYCARGKAMIKIEQLYHRAISKNGGFTIVSAKCVYDPFFVLGLHPSIIQY